MPSLSHTLMRVSIYRQGELVGREIFRERHIVIGRDPTMADLVIGSGQVSREHALLEHDGQRIFLHDLESTNGIVVNGEKVSSAEIRPRDRVFVGEHLLRLELRARMGSLHLPGNGASAGAPGASGGAAPSSEAAPSGPTARMARMATQTVFIPLETGEEAWSRAVPLPPPLPERSGDDDVIDDVIDDEDLPSAAMVLGDTVTLPESISTPMRVAVCKTRGEQLIDLQLVTPGRPFHAGDPHTRERWGRTAFREEPLSVHLNGSTCVVQMPAGQRWSLRRAGEAVTEATGVREGWLKRRRNRVTLTMRRGELLLVEMGGATYHVRFVPLPRTFGRAKMPTAGKRIMIYSAALSLLAHAWIMAGVGLLETPLWTPGWKPPPPIISTTVDVRVNPLIKPAVSPYAAPTAPLASPNPRVPGGNTGFAIIGLPDVAPTEDPSQPQPGAGVTLKRTAAFLRGQGMGFGSLLPAGTGPAWATFVDERPPSMTPQGQLDTEALMAQLHKSEAPLASCYQKFTPMGAGLVARVELNFSVASNGSFANVEPTSAPVSPELLACMKNVITRWRLNRHKGSPSVLASYVFTFKRVGFD